MQTVDEYIAKMNEKKKAGIAKYIEKNGKWGHPITYGLSFRTAKPLTKETFVSEYLELRLKKVPKRAIAKMLSIDIDTLYQRLKDLDVKE